MKKSPKTDYSLANEIVNDIPWFRNSLLSWFNTNKRSFPWKEPDRSAYEVLVAEILLQRTTATAVAEHYETFIERFTSWKDLVSASTGEIEKELKSLGLWRQKAVVFKTLANDMTRSDGKIPRSRKALEELPGIGQYIAGAALLILHNQDEPLLDMTMARVLERFFGPRDLVDIRHDSYLQTLSRNVIKGKERLKLSWAILDHGALVCKKRTPLCVECPLVIRCRYYSESLT